MNGEDASRVVIEGALAGLRDTVNPPSQQGPGNEIYGFSPSATLSGNDVIRIRDFIKRQQTTRCDPLTQTRTGLIQRLVALEMGIRRETTALLYAKALLSPARRIPLELLSMIAEVYAIQNQGSVWAFMQVCRAWKTAAILSIRLWKGICFQPISSFIELGRPSVYHVPCATEERLRAALNYAGSRLTSVWTGVLVNPQIISLLRALNRLGPNIKFHEYKECLCGPVETLPDTPWDFKHLERLSSARRLVLERAVAQSTVLHTLITTTEASSELTSGDWTLRLETLCLRGVSARLSRSILAACTSLRTLTLVIDRVPVGAPSIRLPRLVTFQLYAVQGDNAEWPVNCPNLKDLTVQIVSATFAPVMTTRHPSLKHIICSHISSLSSLVAPDLYQLTVKSMDSPPSVPLAQVLDRIWPSRLPNDSHASMLQLNPIVLTIPFKALAISMQSFVGFLCRLTRLEWFYVQFRPTEPRLHIDLFMHLLREMVAMNSPVGARRFQDVPLKSLKGIIILISDSSPDIPPTMSDFKRVAELFCAFRKQAGFPLTRIALNHGGQMVYNLYCG